MTWTFLAVAVSCVAAIETGEPLQPRATVRVDVPAALLFQISDATPGQVATASSFRVTFSQASLPAGQALRISVKAEGPLVLPGGVAVPIANISWTASQAINGVGVNGVLSAATYTAVYESRADARTGRVDLAWSLLVPSGITRAGTAVVTLRWKFESVIP
jgi:hypothetical protein